MKAYDFKVLLEPDETGGYVATCPSLPGCYSQGDTVDGALDNIREAIELCLEDMQAHGEVIPDPSRFERAVVGDRQRHSRGISRMAQSDMAAALPHDAVAKALERVLVGSVVVTR